MANFDALINGRSYDWSQITLTIAGVPIAGVAKITYKESTEIVDNFGGGRRPVNRGHGNITAEASISLHMEEIERIQALAPQRNIMLLPEFDIGVTFADNDQVPANHVIKNCRFMENARDISQGDTGVTPELPLATSNIEW